MLVLDGVSRAFGGVHALEGVNLRLESGMVLGLIGPNGAGKSTLVNVATGLLAADRGVISLNEDVITGWAPDRIAQAGVVRTYQRCRLFPSYSVADNIAVALAYRRDGSSRPRAKFSRRVPWRRSSSLAGHVEQYLDQLDLAAVADRRVSTLPFGTQRRVEVARAFACRPAFLLLDEPFAGLEPSEMQIMSGLIRGEVARGLGVLLIEHKTKAVLDLSDRVIVLNVGRVLLEAAPHEVAASPEVRAAYLGGD